jgi:hypothetical protein
VATYSPCKFWQNDPEKIYFWQRKAKILRILALGGYFGPAEPGIFAKNPSISRLWLSGALELSELYRVGPFNYGAQYMNYTTSYLRLERRLCVFCGHSFTAVNETQRFCGPRCRAQGRALEGRAARRVWAAAGRPIEENTRAEFEQARALWPTISGAVRR